MEELEEIHSLNLNARLAKFILLRGTSEGRLHMTQSELAAHLGTTREVIAKLLRKMVSAKSVKTLRGSIVIEDADKLAKLAAQD
jgi:CRP/FNR family transcriptional regulator